MRGDIRVNAATPPPPGVSDGTNGTTPMAVAKLAASGADLSVSYDASACGLDADGHNILFGTGSQLPPVPGGTYGLSGSRCDIGTASPFQWIGSPAPPPPGDFLWWIVVADDGAGKEGSWSADSAEQERSGPGVNGSSGTCGNGDKDVTNTCPP
jgi:hypothetical protein